MHESSAEHGAGRRRETYEIVFLGVVYVELGKSQGGEYRNSQRNVAPCGSVPCLYHQPVQQ